MSEDKRSKPLSTKATEEDRADAVKDECGAMYSRDGLRLLKGPERYEIKKGTRVICDEAFSGCWSLREVVIPASVTSIGNYAFWECSSLSSIIVPRGQAGRFRELLRDSNLDLSAISIREQGCEPSNL